MIACCGLDQSIYVPVFKGFETDVFPLEVL